MLEASAGRVRPSASGDVVLVTADSRVPRGSTSARDSEQIDARRARRVDRSSARRRTLALMLLLNAMNSIA